MHEGRGYRYTFQRARVASSPEVPKVTWWKIATFLGYHLHWLTSLETSQHFRKIILRLGIFLAMFRECLCVVARQLAPKCRDFSNVAKLARQCKWAYWWFYFVQVGETTASCPSTPRSPRRNSTECLTPCLTESPRWASSRVSEGWPNLSADFMLNRHKNVDTSFNAQAIFDYLPNVMQQSVWDKSGVIW